MTKRQKTVLWFFFLGPVLAVAAFLYIAIANPFHTHEHCIKNTGLSLRIYATDHDGKCPSDTNGFGNALLLLLKEGYLGGTNDVHSARLITAPGDDGQIFLDAIRRSTRIPEENCSRIYIQGLSETSNPNIAILFDKKPARGGDHFRRPWGPLLREVCMADGSMKVLREQEWPSFAAKQIELLTREGIERSLAKHYYQLAENNPQRD